MTTTFNAYDFLGVPPNATHADIKRAYRAAARKHHPDVGGDEEHFKLLTLAWYHLETEERRRAYDFDLRSNARGHAAPQPAPEDDSDSFELTDTIEFDDFLRRQRSSTRDDDFLDPTESESPPETDGLDTAQALPPVALAAFAGVAFNLLLADEGFKSWAAGLAIALLWCSAAMYFRQLRPDNDDPWVGMTWREVTAVSAVAALAAFGLTGHLPGNGLQAVGVLVGLFAASVAGWTYVVARCAGGSWPGTPAAVVERFPALAQAAQVFRRLGQQRRRDRS